MVKTSLFDVRRTYPTLVFLQQILDLTSLVRIMSAFLLFLSMAVYYHATNTRLNLPSFARSGFLRTLNRSLEATRGRTTSCLDTITQMQACPHFAEIVPPYITLFLHSFQTYNTKSNRPHPRNKQTDYRCT